MFKRLGCLKLTLFDKNIPKWYIFCSGDWGMPRFVRRIVCGVIDIAYGIKL